MAASLLALLAAKAAALVGTSLAIGQGGATVH
jgi:hypothetical protein